MRPSARSTSAVRSMRFAGSMTRPLRMTRGRISAARLFAHHAFEHGHAHGNPVLHLIEDDRAVEIGDFARELAAPVDRAGMHHDGLRARQVEMFEAQAIE